MTDPFNAMPVEVARRHLLTCLDVPRWVDEVVAARPYEGIEGLEDRMTDIAAGISDEELEQALARHPRTGERADAAKHDAGHATREQAGVDRAETIIQLTQIALLRFREVMS